MCNGLQNPCQCGLIPCKPKPDMQFIDRIKYNGTTKTAVSVRDGVQEYLGAEIGMEPPNKTFTVYRSPATIANAAAKMAGIPLTDEHVDLSGPPKNPVGTVASASMVDLVDKSIGCTLAVENKIEVSDAMLKDIESGKRELSLGYRAELVAHDHYDFEQRNIEPHHLAVVDRGRCGAHCSFKDQRINMETEKVADAGPTMEQIVEIASGLPEFIKKLTPEQLAEVMPMLESIKGVAKAAETSTDEELKEPEAPKVATDEVPEVAKVADEDVKKDVTDSAMFKDALASAVEAHTGVIEKARDFVDCAYQFRGKTTAQIMRDALAAEYGKQKFVDDELSVAFKLLKKSASSLQNFGDSAKDPFDSLMNKEI